MKDKAKQPLTVTLREASELSGLSIATLWRRARDGSLRTVLVGRRRLVNLAALEQLLDVSRLDPPPPTGPERRIRRTR